jgi:ribosomal protein S27AE
LHGFSAGAGSAESYGMELVTEVGRQIERVERPTWPAPQLTLARCACGRCGAHTFTNVGYKVAGSCPNCGSFDLARVHPASSETSFAV